MDTGTLKAILIEEMQKYAGERARQTHYRDCILFPQIKLYWRVTQLLLCSWGKCDSDLPPSCRLFIRRVPGHAACWVPAMREKRLPSVFACKCAPARSGPPPAPRR